MSARHKPLFDGFVLYCQVSPCFDFRQALLFSSGLTSRREADLEVKRCAHVSESHLWEDLCSSHYAAASWGTAATAAEGLTS